MAEWLRRCKMVSCLIRAHDFLTSPGPAILGNPWKGEAVGSPAQVRSLLLSIHFLLEEFPNPIFCTILRNQSSSSYFVHAYFQRLPLVCLFSLGESLYGKGIFAHTSPVIVAYGA